MTFKKNITSVLYFGSYDPNYSRNRIIKKGLKANNIDVIQIRANGIFFKRYVELVSKFLKLKGDTKALIVGFPGHYDVFLAFLLGKLFNKKIYYDIFASTYETYVLDRKVIRKNSIRAKFFYVLDWLGLKLADYVIIDTKAHGNFYKKLYSLDPKKTVLVYVGSDPDYFYPRRIKEETDVLFYGSYQPLQGTDVIVKAAAKLPGIKFKMIGNGQKRKSTEKISKSLKLKNVEFIDWMPLEKLALEIAKAKICLGIFGAGEKANIVIPNKIYDYLASEKAVITENNDAIKEIFENRKNIILVPPGNYKTLVFKINNLITKNKDRKYLSRNGNIIFNKSFGNTNNVLPLIFKIKEN